MPLITIDLFEGRTEEQKKAVASGIMEVLSKELGAGPEHTWIIFKDCTPENWFTGAESNADIMKKRNEIP